MMGIKNKSLTAQIKDAEQELLNHQQRFDVHSTMLIRTISQQISPATPLLAAGIGFIFGELTRRRNPGSPGVADKRSGTANSLWKTALNLMTSLQTLNSALPLDLIMKRIYQPDASGQANKRPLNPVKAPVDDSPRNGIR